MDELYSMMASVTQRAESYKEWLCSVQDILENKGDKKRGKTKSIPLYKAQLSRVYPSNFKGIIGYISNSKCLKTT